MKYIIDWFGDNQDDIIPAVGPGHWNDPDQVLQHGYSKLQHGAWHLVLQAACGRPLPPKIL